MHLPLLVVVGPRPCKYCLPRSAAPSCLAAACSSYSCRFQLVRLQRLVCCGIISLLASQPSFILPKPPTTFLPSVSIVAVFEMFSPKDSLFLDMMHRTWLYSNIENSFRLEQADVDGRILSYPGHFMPLNPSRIGDSPS
jgi:hypothetical protein